jgi:peptidoglycan/LPS O-acetylase OafA/YrhL
MSGTPLSGLLRFRRRSVARTGGAAGGRIWFAQMLRGLALITVLIEHMLIAFWINNPGSAAAGSVDPVGWDVIYLPHVQPSVWLVTHGIVIGEVGVALFFLISGFVIPMSLERYRPGRFLVGRFFRLYPVWLACLAVTAAALFIYAEAQGRAFPPHDWGAWWRNATLFQDWFDVTNINPVAWTLLVEVKFYLLIAAMAWIVGLARATPIAVVACAVASVSIFASGKYGHLAAEHPELTRALNILVFTGRFIPVMFMGMCFYNLHRGVWGPRRFLAMMALMMGLFFFAMNAGTEGTFYRDMFLLNFSIGLSIWTICYWLGPRIPYSRTMNFLADVSYPVYALHYIVGIILLTVFYDLHASPYLNTLEAIAVLLVLAWLIHRFVEDPANRLGKRIRLPGWVRFRRREPALAEPAPARADA